MFANIWARITNWNSTFFGTGIGAIGAAIVMKIMTDAGCHWEQVQWPAIWTFVSSTIVGALLTDNGKAV